MSKVITFSRHFQKNHPKSGQPTHFVEQILYGLIKSGDPRFGTELLKQHIVDIESLHPDKIKHHTIRGGKRFKKGDFFSPRVWSGKPYASKQIQFAPDVEVKQVWDFKITTEDDDGEHDWSYVEFLGKRYACYGYGGYDDKIMVDIATNDGLSIRDFYDWLISGRTKQQRLDCEPKIFDGQIICWSDTVKY